MRLLVNVDVVELEKAALFYTEALGLRVGRRFGGDAIELLGVEVPIYLLVKQPGTAPFHGAATTRDYARHWTPVHLDFDVDDLEVAVTRAMAAGAILEEAISDHPWGRMAIFSDPFGNGFCLLQLSERGYDAIATGSDRP